MTARAWGRVPRDRDPAGARNARPRDGLGRPLDRADADAGAGEDRIPDDLVITGREAAVLADRLLRDGRPFHAHEVLEAAWKTGPPDDRDLWQGLAQIAVGLTHARRGNARGAVALLRRGTQRIRARTAQPTDGPVTDGRDQPYGMDIPAFLAAADDLAARIEQDGLDGIPPADLTPRLLRSATPDRVVPPTSSAPRRDARVCATTPAPTVGCPIPAGHVPAGAAFRSEH